MSSLLRKRVHDRFPKKWLIVLLFFVSAELPGTASGERPAPGTGAPSAFNGATTTTSFSSSQTRDHLRLKLFRSPIESTRWGLGPSATRFQVPRQTGRKNKGTHNELQSAHNHRLHRQERRNQATTERNSRYQVLGRHDTLLEGR